jgi:alkylation response protein AidB-like acyl-CoA dehydrogenase
MTSDQLSPDLLHKLAVHAQAADEVQVWPAASWTVLRDLGALRWSIPAAYGGEERDGADLLARYETLASACLTTCFLLSQREAAVRRVCASGNDSLCWELLPELASGARFDTVGLAQLSTSRQHGKPAVSARLDGDHFVIDGTIPWVTGAPQADHIIVGAVVEGAGQIIAVMPTTLPGINIAAPLDLMALAGSLTAEVRCSGVRLPRRFLLAGPADKVLQGARGGTGGLETSCLALGLAGAAISHLVEESARRPDLLPDAERLEASRNKLRAELYQIVGGPSLDDAPLKLRARANALVLQATQAALTASKGTGFLRQHPAQRWARQALFFLVWSCPAQVAAATMAYLTSAGEQVCF